MIRGQAGDLPVSGLIIARSDSKKVIKNEDGHLMKAREYKN